MRSNTSRQPLFAALVRRVRAFRRDARGATAILMAGSMTVIIGASALAVDVGSMYYAKRRAQTAVDLAAIAGAGSLPSYEGIVRASLADNGFSFSTAGGGGDGAPASALTMVPGRYTPDPAIAVAQRFQPSSAATANALRVTMRRTTPIYFGRYLTGDSEATYEVTGAASAATSAAFSIGTRLLRFEGGIANALLSGLLGVNVSLSVMDYNALATAKIEMFPFLDALGNDLNIRAGSYNSLLEADGAVGKVYGAAARILAATGETRAADALRRIATGMDAARLAVKLRSIIDLGDQGSTSIGEGPAVAAQFSALSLLTTTAQVANASRQVSLDLGLTLPGLASAKLTLAIGERPVHRVWLANGRPGLVQAHTAQTRLLLDVKVLGGGALPLGIRLPVYVELAAGDAQLANVRCRVNAADTRVDIDARPGIVDAWIGDVGMAQFNNMTTPVNPRAADLATVLLLRITGRAHATMSNVTYERMSFSMDDIRNLQPRTVRTRDFTTSLLTRLVGDLDLRIEPLGALDLGLLMPAVRALTQSVTPSVDALLYNVLTLLGIGLGEADVWANGVRCDGGVLVN